MATKEPGTCSKPHFALCSTNPGSIRVLYLHPCDYHFYSSLASPLSARLFSYTSCLSPKTSQKTHWSRGNRSHQFVPNIPVTLPKSLLDSNQAALPSSLAGPVVIWEICGCTLITVHAAKSMDALFPLGWDPGPLHAGYHGKKNQMWLRPVQHLLSLD